MQVRIRPYRQEDIEPMCKIWNEVVEEGQAFPQMELLDSNQAALFFQSQSLSAVAERNGQILGLYILHPNNIGRCAHIANASFAVCKEARRMHVGQALVSHCLSRGAELGFRILQFNAVVKSNHGAIALYEKLGFVKLGEIPGGFLRSDGGYEDIALYYHLL